MSGVSPQSVRAVWRRGTELWQSRMIAPAPPSPAVPPRAATILSPFKADLFISHATWIELERILSGHDGGSFGLSGPRGAGKSWMMGQAITSAGAQNGLGVWFPSPSEYEATAFLAALSDVTATRYEQIYDARTGRTTAAARRRFVKGMAGSIGLLALAGAWQVYLQGLSPFVLVQGAFVVAAAWLAGRTLSQRREDRSPQGRVRRAAEELRQQVRFIVTTKESSEFGGDAGQFGLSARLKRARERQLVERPATLSSLVHNFRAFAVSVASVMEGPVVIAIDELDKMSDPARVAGLLRDIKGIFEIPGVYFLVSLSDEASRSLDLGALRTRNEFNSSFYTVLSLPPLSPQQGIELLRRRDDQFDEELGKAFGVLGGGIPREIVRLGDVACGADLRTASWQRPVIEAMKAEAAAFVDDVLANQTIEDLGLRAEDNLALWRHVECIASADDASFSTHAWSLLDAWDLNSDSPAWRTLYQEQWRRLVLRLTIAGLMIARPSRLDDTGALAELQRAARTAGSAAVVARARIAEYITAELCDRAMAIEQLDDQQVELAFFVLRRRDQPFSGRDFLAPGRRDEDLGADKALRTFSQYGIVQQHAFGGGSARWSLTETAARAVRAA